MQLKLNENTHGFGKFIDTESSSKVIMGIKIKHVLLISYLISNTIDD